MTRKSARLQSKRKADTQINLQTTGAAEPPQKRIKSSEFQDSDEEGFEDQQVSEPSSHDATESTSSSRKKTRVSSNSSKKKAMKLVPVDERFKKVRGRLGLLHKLVTEIPLDVIFEIFAHLRPLDILRLSRTSQDLYKLLTSRSSEHVWRNARLNVEGLPPLPTDLNEIQYAKLMFDTICQVCGNHCYTVFWDCRVRCCKKCVHEVLLPEHMLHREHCRTMPQSSDFYRYIVYVPHDRTRVKRGMEELFLSSTFKSISDDYRKSVKVLNDAGERVTDAQKLAAWKLPMNTKRTEHQHYTRLCEQWSKGQRDSREDELREIRQQRRSQIEDRLIELGWGPELECLRQENASDNFWNHKLIRQSKLLTDRLWDQITPTIFELLQPVRDRRLRVERVNALKPRYEALKRCYDIYIFQQKNLKKSGFPPFGDVIESHIGYDIIFNTPYEQTLSEDAFDEELKKLPNFIDDWNKRKTQDLVEIVQKDIPEATVDTLGLAKTVFVCETCKDFLWYPEVFQHCCYPRRRADWETREYVPSNLDIYHGFNPYDQCGSVPWNKHSTRIIFWKDHSIHLSLIMQTCGLDPDTAFHEDLDSLNDVILECKPCYHNGRRNFMRWSRASHVPTPVKPSEQLRQKLPEFEKPKEWKRIRIAYTCDHCPDTPTGKQNRNYGDLCSHLLQEHGKEQVTRKDWSYEPSVTFSEKAPGQFTLEWPEDDVNDTPQV
ncbi:hypothetical protein K435DRAFT_845502 [Dendrothele bispora CBS 962.96]|uniref:F-box domain-containing protein n=1 Tax=Dendrothele bispora (strain CBS 962.96) TaxID=1314807 RepID=A0A4S8KTY7_DENBC|nr:hypothetical protein K435DRAFT_845502 [Dendrothele bispora CBS 962.96]